MNLIQADLATGSVTTRRAWIKTGAAALVTTALRGDPAWSEPIPHQLPGSQHPAIRARLSLNENAFGCSALATEAIRNGLDSLNRYTERPVDVLVQQVAATEGVAPDQVVLGNTLAVLGTHLGLAGGARGEFIYSTPAFTDLVSAAERAGGVAVGIPLNSRLENDLATIASRVTARTRAVFIVNPHNPSGTLTTHEALMACVREISRRALVILDEAYLEYTDDFKARTLAPLVGAGGNVVVFRTFDKIHGLAALQFGYALVPRELAQTLHQQGIGAPHGLNSLAVIAAAAALRDTKFVNDTRAKVAIERAQWHTALERLGLPHSDSHGSFVFFQAGRPQRALAAAFLARGIDIGRDFPPLDDWTRVSIGLPEENALAIDALREIVGRG
jgi:histidinol-phosphate aminotransferase